MDHFGNFKKGSADTCGGKFPLVWMGVSRRVSRAQTRERGPPSALAEFGSFLEGDNGENGLVVIGQ